MPDHLISPNRRILVIDDNPAIHADFRKILELGTAADAEFAQAEAALFPNEAPPTPAPSFKVDSAFQGEEGLARVIAAAQSGRPYAMAFIDMRMPPGWDGLETTIKIWEVCPEVQVVICTAYSDHSWEEILESAGRSDRLLLLKKPFDNIEVLQLAQALTEKWRLLQQANAQTELLERRVAERTRLLVSANEALQAEMLERARVEEALRQAQKMEAVGQLAAGVAHDFNNLLCVIRGYSGILINHEALSASAIEAVREMDSAAERAATLTRQLLTFSRRQVVQPEALQLSEVVQQVSKLLQRVLGESVTIIIETSGPVPGIFADRGMVEQIILNLAVNARDAMPTGGPLRLHTSAAEIDAGQAALNPLRRVGRFACLSVTDHGCGISAEIMPRLFEPFFTTKEVGKGTGLGLATVYGIVRQHEGWIEVESAPGRGTVFRIFLPESLRPVTAGPAPVVAPVAPATGPPKTILLVEDEASLRLVAQLVLEQYGFRVIVATSGQEALEKWPSLSAEIDLLFTDMVMPGGVSGRELAAQLQQEKPVLRVLFSSGYSREIAHAGGAFKEGLNFLAKPYTAEKLAATIRDCLDRPPVPVPAA